MHAIYRMLSLLILLYLYPSLLIADYSEAEINQQIKVAGGLNQYLKEIAETINKQLPVNVGKNREMISVMVEDNTIAYIYKFTKTINQEYYLSKLKECENNWLASICQGYANKILFNKGATVRHYSSTKEGDILSRFDANKTKCDNL